MKNAVVKKFSLPVALVVTTVVAIVLAVTAHAHDLITAELAEAYIDKAARWQRQSRTDPDKLERARARLRIGTMLDEIRDFLNRDLAAHGEVQGLASNFLVAELERIGTPLAFSAERRYFTANSAHYRAALEAGLDGAHAAEARLQLLRGEFYDSFDVDPLVTNQTPRQVLEQLALAERVVRDAVQEPEREESRFIVAVVCARAARLASDANRAVALRDKAVGYMDAFLADYPDSLRSAAMPVLKQALEIRR